MHRLPDVFSYFSSFTTSISYQKILIEVNYLVHFFVYTEPIIRCITSARLTVFIFQKYCFMFFIFAAVIPNWSCVISLQSLFSKNKDPLFPSIYDYFANHTTVISLTVPS